MKLLKPKFPPKPENRFQEFLRNQPVFNWFDKYEKNGARNSSCEFGDFNREESWVAKING